MGIKTLAGLIGGLIGKAEGLIEKTGAEKKAFVLEQIAKLDDKTALAVIPNGLEEQFLNFLVDYTVALIKKK